MPDIMTVTSRSDLMRRVRTKDTLPEVKVRRALHAVGLRFRLHRKDLPGTSDIVLPRFKTCLFVHGCFWHGHEGCSKARLPNTRKSFWVEKISKTRERDKRKRNALEREGWKVVIIWECETKSNKKLANMIEGFRMGVCESAGNIRT